MKKDNDSDNAGTQQKKSNKQLGIVFYFLIIILIDAALLYFISNALWRARPLSFMFTRLPYIPIIVAFYLYPAINFIAGIFLYVKKFKDINFSWKYDIIKNPGMYTGLLIVLVLHNLFRAGLGEWDSLLIPVIGFSISGLLSLFLGFNFIQIERKIWGTSSKPQPSLDESEIKTYAKKVLYSDEFITSLRSKLPSGERDEYGFISSLSDGIQERRRKFEKSSRWFLGLTILFGIIFVGVLVYFGYIFVEEDAVGSGNYLKKIENSTDIIKKDLAFYIQPTAKIETFKRDFYPLLDTLNQRKWVDSGVISERTFAKIGDQIDEVKSSGKLNNLNDILNKARNEISGIRTDKKSSELLTMINNILAGIKEFEENKLKTAGLVESRLEKLDELIPRVSAEIKKPKNRIPELLKRISIGIIIASFFLAIMKYLSKLYKERFQEAVEAHRDNLTLIAYYTGYRCTEPNTEERKIVLQEFIKALAAIDTRRVISSKGLDTSPKESEVVKNLLKIAAREIAD